MNTPLLNIITATLTFLLLDGIWLGVIAKSFYRDNLSSFLGLSGGQLAVNWPSAIIVYVVLIAGIVLFPVAKAGDSLKLALIWGFLFGITVYGTYGFTNHALVQNWPLKVSVIDTFWGGALCALTSFATVYFSSPR